MPEIRKKLRDAALIAISGKQYVGKDRLADLLMARLPGLRKVPLALAIKQEFASRSGLTLETIEANKAAYRPELIRLGDWGRQQDPDYWLKKAMAEPGPKIISDMRLKREYDYFREAGAFLIRLEANREVRAQRGQIVNEDDPTERALDNINAWDAVLHNQGAIEALAAQVDQLLA